MRPLITKALAAAILCLVAFEGLSAVAIYTRLIPAARPSFVLPAPEPFWADRNKVFGVWHPRNVRYVHASACFNHEYRSNAHGARDRDRELDSAGPRIVMLGDSFIEGYGLARADRVSDRLEAATGIPHLNFGTAGAFGPTQYVLLYKTLAKRFRHDAVIVGLLPDNDFLDDDSEFGRSAYPDRYRPYYVGDAPDYRLDYFDRANFGVTEKIERQARRRFVQSLLRNFTHAANAIDYFRIAIRYFRSLDAVTRAGAKPYSGYFDYTPQQFERLQFVLRQLLAETAGKPVVIALIPRPNDLAHIRDRGEPRLTTALTQFLASHRQVTVLDLSPVFRAGGDPKVYYNGCDGHWTVAGSRLAFEALRKLPIYNK